MQGKNGEIVQSFSNGVTSFSLLPLFGGLSLFCLEEEYLRMRVFANGGRLSKVGGVWSLVRWRID
jgi:hypothetical protein